MNAAVSGDLVVDPLRTTRQASLLRDTLVNVLRQRNAREQKEA